MEIKSIDISAGISQSWSKSDKIIEKAAFGFWKLAWSASPKPNWRQWHDVLLRTSQLLSSIPILLIDLLIITFLAIVLKIGFMIIVGVWLVTLWLLIAFINTVILKPLGKATSLIATLAVVFGVYFLYKSDKWIVIYELFYVFFSFAERKFLSALF